MAGWDANSLLVHTSILEKDQNLATVMRAGATATSLSTVLPTQSLLAPLPWLSASDSSSSLSTPNSCRESLWLLAASGASNTESSPLLPLEKLLPEGRSWLWLGEHDGAGLKGLRRLRTAPPDALTVLLSLALAATMSSREATGPGGAAAAAAGPPPSGGSGRKPLYTPSGTSSEATVSVSRLLTACSRALLPRLSLPSSGAFFLLLPNHLGRVREVILASRRLQWGRGMRPRSPDQGEDGFLFVGDSARDQTPKCSLFTGGGCSFFFLFFFLLDLLVQLNLLGQSNSAL